LIFVLNSFLFVATVEWWLESVWTRT